MASDSTIPLAYINLPNLFLYSLVSKMCQDSPKTCQKCANLYYRGTSIQYLPNLVATCKNAAKWLISMRIKTLNQKGDQAGTGKNNVNPLTIDNFNTAKQENI